jgi:hypothetical protein
LVAAPVNSHRGGGEPRHPHLGSPGC